MHPTLKRGTKNFHYTSKTCGIFSDFNFPWNNNRTEDMKVHVYSKFRKNKISKIINSPNSMRIGRFDTSKYRGKLEKMGVLCIHSPKSPGPFFKLPIKNWPMCKRKLEKNKKFQKKGPSRPCPGVNPRATAGCWPALIQQSGIRGRRSPVVG
jgi:hypothetical protein